VRIAAQRREGTVIVLSCADPRKCQLWTERVVLRDSIRTISSVIWLASFLSDRLISSFVRGFAAGSRDSGTEGLARFDRTGDSIVQEHARSVPPMG
jgi:hypothetical protein